MKLTRFTNYLIPINVKERIIELFNVFRSVFYPEPYRTVLPYTILSIKRLKNLINLVDIVNKLEIEGDIVECGTYNGGSAAVLATAARKSSFKRHIYIIDSFQGLPEASIKDSIYANQYAGMCKGNENKVKEVLSKVGVERNNYTLVKGWFHEVLPSLTIKKISLLHIDADWYESVKLCLDNLFDKVVVGGFVVLDDYGFWEGCRKALTEFATRRNFDISLEKVDNTGVYFKKTQN